MAKRPKRPARPAKRPAKAKVAPKIRVSLVALGNSELSFEVKRGTSVGDFLADHIPADWNRENFEFAVNDRPSQDDVILNDGDVITAAPFVAGGNS